jgi:hypothetical protein
MIAIKPSHTGKLHAAMGIPPGKTISMADLMKTKRRAKSSGNTKLEKEATFAENAKSWNKGGKAC